MTTKRQKVTHVILCTFCGKEVPIEVYADDLDEFFSPNRRHIQDIFPYLSDAEREMFISRVCPECWDDMFSSMEDADEECGITPEDLKEWQDASCGKC